MPKKAPAPPTAAPAVALPSPVVTQVLNDFLDVLEKDSEVPPTVVQRLRTALIDRADTSPDGLRRALFDEEFA
jgi:hypothetical protein